MPDAVDFVVIGAGAAGGVMAKELAAGGLSVVVLEQGSHRGLERVVVGPPEAVALHERRHRLGIGAPRRLVGVDDLHREAATDHQPIAEGEPFVETRAGSNSLPP